MMRKTIDWIQGHTTTLLLVDLVIALVLGILFPDLFTFFKKYALVASFLMIYPVMINTDLKSVRESIYNTKFISISLIFHFVVSPLILFAILRLIVHDASIAAGLMFIAIMPSSGMSVVWTNLSKGTAQLAIIVLAISSLLAIVLVPVGAYLVLGQFVQIPMDILIKSILILLLLPVVLGYVTRQIVIWYLGKAKFIEAKPYIKTMSTLGLLTIVFIAFGMEAETLLSDPSLVLQTAVPMVLYYFLGFALMTWIGIRANFSKEDIIALNFSSLTKNRSMAMAIAIVALDPLSVTAIALAGVLAQTPMMVLYRKYGDKILTRYAD